MIENILYSSNSFHNIYNVEKTQTGEHILKQKCFNRLLFRNMYTDELNVVMFVDKRQFDIHILFEL
jgi:hypothetical protein